MPKSGEPPKLRIHRQGYFFVRYGGKDLYFGKDKARAEARYDNWVEHIWARDQLGKRFSKSYKVNWDVPHELAGLARELREYIGWTYPACVYFLVKGDFLDYIGGTNDLANRIRQHLNDGRSFDRVLWIPCNEEHVHKLEHELIQKLQPPGNQRGRGPKRPRTEFDNEVWKLLFTDATPNGTVTATVPSLARRVGCNDTEIRRALLRLVAARRLKMVKRGTFKGGGGRRSVWRVLTPDGTTIEHLRRQDSEDTQASDSSDGD